MCARLGNYRDSTLLKSKFWRNVEISSIGSYIRGARDRKHNEAGG